VRLGPVIATYRWHRRVGVRDLAKEIGISAATLNRFERDGNCDADTLTKILAWLFSSETSWADELPVPGRRKA